MMSKAILSPVLAKASTCATGWRSTAKAGGYFNQQIVEPIAGKTDRSAICA